MLSALSRIVLRLVGESPRSFSLRMECDRLREERDHYRAKNLEYYNKLNALAAKIDERDAKLRKLEGDKDE